MSQERSAHYGRMGIVNGMSERQGGVTWLNLHIYAGIKKHTHARTAHYYRLCEEKEK